MTTIQKNGPVLKLAGYFQASANSYLSGLSLNNVPGYYNIIDVSTAVLDAQGMLKFDWNPSTLNIPMVKEVRTEKNMTVLLSVGGENGNFNFLNSSSQVTNFYNSLAEFYINWGFDGIAFDIRQLDSANLPYIVKAIQWFHESFPEAVLSIIAQATDVCPAAGGIDKKWNRLAPLINQLRDIIDWLQVRAYGYGSAYEELKNTQPTQPPPPSSPPREDAGNTIPIGDPGGMLEYIFASFVKPFVFSSPTEQDDITGTYGYYGFDAAKLMLGVQPVSLLGPEYYVDPQDLRQVIQDLKNNYNETAGGVMISSINDDARNIYDYTRRFTGQ